MAEAIGGAAGVVALAQVAFESCGALYKLVKSFRSHNSRVRELELELNALCEVLCALSDHVKELKADSSTLSIPLQQCTNVCADFHKEIMKYTSPSDGTHTSFRSWAKLRYMGDDIDGFRRLLSSYKLTMTIALNDANLQTSAATAESVENYYDLIQTTQEDLRDRLQGMDEKLERLLGGDAALSEPDAREVKLIRDERLSTEKCLQICAELSGHIAQLQHTAMHSLSTEEPSSVPTAGKIYSDGLQECADSLARTSEKLASCENDLLDRLFDKTRTTIGSDEGRATLLRLRDELNATRRSMEICARAREHLREEVATIDNYATGDAIQLMVSINEKPIHGKNRGMGWRTRQLGGYVDKDSVREALKSFSSVSTQVSQNESSSTAHDCSNAESCSKGNESQSAFNGKGFSLASPPVSSDKPLTQWH